MLSFGAPLPPVRMEVAALKLDNLSFLLSPTQQIASMEATPWCGPIYLLFKHGEWALLQALALGFVGVLLRVAGASILDSQRRKSF